MLGDKRLVKPGAGAAVTTSDALAEPELPNADVRSPLPAVTAPGVELVTSTETVQVAPAAAVPPDKLIVDEFAVATRLPPVQEVEAFVTEAIVSPLPSDALKARSVASMELPELSMLNNSDVVPA